MGITWIRNGVVVDRTADENDSGPAGDGRTYLPFASKSYNQDSTTDVVTDRAFNATIKLPPSGNYTKVYADNKMTEASATDNSQDGSDNIRNLQQAGADYDADVARQNAQNAAAYASATNLVTVGSVLGTANYTAVVKPAQS